MKAAGGREACFAIDAQQEVVMWAPAAEAMLGFEAREALGRLCCQVMSGSDVFGRPLCCAQCRACLNGSAPLPPPAHHFLIRHRDGRLLRLVHELVPLPSGPGARALVLLGEAGAQPGIAADDLLAPGRTPPDLASFASILKGLAALGLVADSLSSFSFYQTLDSTLDRVLSLTGGETAEVFLWNRGTREMCLTAHRGLFRSAFRQISRFEPSQGYPGLVASTGQALITRELAQDPRFLRTRVKEKGVHFYMAVPLLASRGVIGCLNIASRRSLAGEENLLRLLSWLAAPLSSASELAVLRSQETVDLLEEGETPLGALPRQVLKAMVDAAEAEQGLIALWGPEGAAVDTAHSGIGYPEHYVILETHPGRLTPCLGKEKRLVCPACRQGRPLILSATDGQARPACRESLGEARGAICIPIAAGGSSLGVASLRFLRPQPVPTRPLALLGAIAPRAGRLLAGVWPYLSKGSRAEVAGEAPGGARGLRSYALREAGGQEKGAERKSGPGGLVPFLDIRCFGSFQVFRDGKPLIPASFGRRQSFTVLKVLVTRRERPVSTELLSEVLWPEDSPDATSKRLWVVIHSLRTGLEPGLKSGQDSHFVRRNGGSYCFGPEVPYCLDVAEFLDGAAGGERLETEGDPRGAMEAYESAVRLYRGDFLEDETYSDWCSAEREYLREVYLSLLKRLASLCVALDDWDRSIYWHRRALLVDSLREEVHRELIRCLWRAGRRDEALRQYQECRRVLELELGVDPLPETEEIYRQILRTPV